MQLYAYNKKEELIVAHKAIKGKDYFCMECKEHVRLRGGIHRRHHFYHKNKICHCRQSSKTLQHLQTQYFLQNVFGEKNSTLEYHFPNISRIADVVWHRNKVVFEVQCSSISPEELASRNYDYASEGFRVIWILHDNRYNKKKLSAAEKSLKNHPHYFTNINSCGEGFIYDQFSLIKENRRMSKSMPYPISIEKMYSWESTSPLIKYPNIFKDRFASWKLCFQGDLCASFLEKTQSGSFCEEIQRWEDAYALLFPKTTFFYHLKNAFFRILYRPYKIVFNALLEKACR